jgi:hypothetical protein
MNMSTWALGQPLISKNGDAELWVQLCASRQMSPVRAVRVAQFLNARYEEPPSFSPLYTQTAAGATITVDGQNVTLPLLFDPEDYGDQPLMTPEGVVHGVPFGEARVWCLARETSEPARQRQLDWVAAHPIARADGTGEEPYPLCPTGVEAWDSDDMRTFATRGAMAAGLAVMTYLRAIAAGEITPEPLYSECHLL